MAASHSTVGTTCHQDTGDAPNQRVSASIAAPAELIVILNPYDSFFSEFVGSRAMLEAEGIIPDGTKWPEGYDDKRWQAGKFNYWLRRQRPEGAKGPRRAFADCDWWCLRWELTNAPSYGQRAILLKERALKNEIYRQSPKGRDELNKLVKALGKAGEDEKFQEFKALVPGLIPPKRGRRQRGGTRVDR